MKHPSGRDHHIIHSHIDADGGVVDGERDPVLHILLDLCEAAGGEEKKTLKSVPRVLVVLARE